MSDEIVLHRRHMFSLAELALEPGAKLEFAVQTMLTEMADHAQEHGNRNCVSTRVYIDIEEVWE